MLKEKITRTMGTIKLGAKRNAPELLLAGGIVAGAGAMYAMNKAGQKALTVKANHLIDEAEIQRAVNELDLGEEEVKKMVVKSYSHYALELAKTYAVPAGLYIASVSMIFASYKVQKNRNIGLSVALGACTKAYNELNARLKNGAAAGLTAKEVLDGIQAREVVDEETGEIKIEKYQVEGLKDPGTVRFDRYSTSWNCDKHINRSLLYSEENWANSMLRLQGYLFLNDVYSRLGLPNTKEGQVLGWVWNADESIYVDFGVVDCLSYDDVRYDENAFDLTINVQGDILTNFGN